MKVLLTGNLGKIGKVVENDLHSLGQEVIGYDLLDSEDILDVPSLNAAIKGCEVVIHLAALDIDNPSSSEPNPYDIMNVNLQGMWNVLTAASQAKYQNNGIGAECMIRIIKEASDLNVPVKLQVLKVDTRALAFYKRLGFEITAETDTHYLMARL